MRIVGFDHIIIGPEFKPGDHPLGVRNGRHEDKRDPRDITEETAHLGHVKTAQSGVQKNETRPEARDCFGKWLFSGRVDIEGAQPWRKVCAEFARSCLVVYY